MSNDKSAEEIVRGLRAWSRFGYYHKRAETEYAAADLIESQAAEIAKLLERVAELEAQLAGAGANQLIQAHIIEGQRNPLDADKIVRLTMENASLRTQLSASQQRERAAVEDMQRMHSLCMDVGGCCPECGDQIDTLMDAACDFCKKSGVNCWVETTGDESKCAAFEWRGPQKDGEGERDG